MCRWDLHITDEASVSRILLMLRQATGKTSRQVAVEIPVSPGSLLEYEQGKTMPTVVTLAKIFRYYGEMVTLGWYYGSKGGDGDG